MLRCSSPCPESLLKTKAGQEVTFSIKKSFGSRKGWKIMPDDGHHNIDASALQSVVSIIKDMEIKVSFLCVKVILSFNLIFHACNF